GGHPGVLRTARSPVHPGRGHRGRRPAGHRRPRGRHRTTLTQPLGDLRAGRYTLAYRVTSTDGHPVSGKTSFTVTGASPATPAATAGAGTHGGGTRPQRPYLLGVLGLLAVAAGWWIARRAASGGRDTR